MDQWFGANIGGVRRDRLVSELAETWGLGEPLVRRMICEAQRFLRVRGVKLASRRFALSDRDGVPTLTFYDSEWRISSWLTLDVNRTPDLMFFTSNGTPIP